MPNQMKRRAAVCDFDYDSSREKLYVPSGRFSQVFGPPSKTEISVPKSLSVRDNT
jgi:hypothetical protein